MVLSKRLSKVLEYIDEFDKVADIGADHGYLSIAMLEKGVKFVQVVENKTEPLKRAQSALLGYDNVLFSLSDGLTDLDDDINTATICGMGGLNIVEILSNSIEKAQKLDKLILQPNSKVVDLRTFLVLNGFIIIDEDIIEEKNTFYEVIYTKYTGAIQTNISEEDLYFGPILIKKQPLCFVKKYRLIMERYTEILNHSKINNYDDIENLKKQINMIKKNVKVD